MDLVNQSTNLMDLESSFRHGLECIDHALALVEAKRESNQIFEVASVALVVVLHLFHRARSTFQVRVKPLIQPISIKHRMGNLLSCMTPVKVLY